MKFYRLGAKDRIHCSTETAILTKSNFIIMIRISAAVRYGTVIQISNHTAVSRKAVM